MMAKSRFISILNISSIPCHEKLHTLLGSLEIKQNLCNFREQNPKI